MKVLNIMIKSIIDNIKGYTGEIVCKYTNTLIIVKYKKFFARIMSVLVGDKLHYKGGITFQRILTADFAEKGNSNIYEVGDRIAQLIIMPYPKVNLVEVEELQSGERGDKGYGSTGR